MTTTGTRLILDANEGDTIEVFYDSPHSDDEKRVMGEATTVDRGLWVRLNTEYDETVEVFGDETANRENGEVVRDGRRIGYLTGFTIHD